MQLKLSIKSVDLWLALDTNQNKTRFNAILFSLGYKISNWISIENEVLKLNVYGAKLFKRDCCQLTESFLGAAAR